MLLAGKCSIVEFQPCAERHPAAALLLQTPKAAGNQMKAIEEVFATFG
ncbi:hypothetical protein [Enhydrobacter aerosaccus]|nr:hypothetical protein [Enhydrobacter aerosaccus]